MIKTYGIIEIKRLKILKNGTIEQLALDKPPELLKLLITEAEYCNFILYSNAGKMFVERTMFKGELLNTPNYSGKNF